jgi:hypothetical protein
MSFAHGERHLAITSAIMMGKRHDNLFGHICIYRRLVEGADLVWVMH